MTFEIMLSRFHWLQLTNEQRILMRETFDIPKSGGVEMMGNKIMSDGSNETDLKAVNIQSMKKFLGEEDSDDTFASLFDKTIIKIDAILFARQNPEPVQEKTNIEKFVEMYNSLTGEEQKEVRSIYFKELEEIKETIINEVNPETPNVTIKKAGRPKKA